MSAKSAQVTLRLSDELREAIDAEAEEQGVSTAEVIRRTLEAGLVRPCERCHGTGHEPS